MNPRLPIEWLEYLVTIGARNDAEGWRWKIDPVMRFGGFGPWRPEWSLYRLANVGVPLLGILATVPERMGFGTRLADVAPYLPPDAPTSTSSTAAATSSTSSSRRRPPTLVLEFLGMSAP